MKTLMLFFGLLFLFQSQAFAQTTFDIEPSQSMLMTGKKPGQDATINPYDGKDCYVVVENIGPRAFTVRIQDKGTFIKEILVKKGKTKTIKLPAGYELYLDPNPDGVTKGRVSYKKLKD